MKQKMKKILDRIPINKGALEAGAVAPDFTLPGEDGNPVTLSDVLERGPVMLVFYPGDFTPTCTAQLCGYRDHWSDFQRFGIQILGISDDPVESHQEFRAARKLPFPLLADPERRVIAQYSGTSVLAGGRANRANYIIDRDGIVLYAHVETVALTHRSSEDLIEVLEGLEREGKLA